MKRFKIVALLFISLFTILSSFIHATGQASAIGANGGDPDTLGSDGTPSTISDSQIAQYASDYCVGDKVSKDTSRFHATPDPVGACKAGFNAGFRQNPSKDEACKDQKKRGANNSGTSDYNHCTEAYDDAVSIGPQRRDSGQSSDEIAQLAAKYCVGDAVKREANASYYVDPVKACVDGYTGGYMSALSKDEACDGKKESRGNGVQGSDKNLCKSAYNAGVKAGSAINPAAFANPSATTTDDGSSGDNDEKDLGCDGQFSNPLTWFICPALDLMSSAITAFDNTINDQLNIKSDQIFCAGRNSCDAYYNAWKSFRSIALGLLLISGLIVVTAQALGMEILDAYTIRKVLPRIVIVAIAISLSWPLMQFFIQLSNDLGIGIRHLIYKPFNGFSDDIDLTFGEGGIANVLFGTVTVGAAATGFVFWAAFGGLGVLLTMAVSVGLAALVAVLTLIIRQDVVILFTLISPAAFLLYILPNTQRFFKMFTENFGKLLLMFVLISGLIAVGRIFAALAIASAAGNPALMLVAVASYIVPYVALPRMLRASGAVMGMVADQVQGLSKPAAGALQKRRQKQLQTVGHRFKAGETQGKKWIPGSITAAQKIGDVSKGIGGGWNARYGFGDRGKAYKAEAEQTEAGEVAKRPGMQARAGDNDVLRLLAMGKGDERRGYNSLVDHLRAGGDKGDLEISEADAHKRASAAMKRAKVAGTFDGAHAIAAFRMMAQDGTMIRDVDDLATLAATVGGGDFGNTWQFAAEATSVSKRVGRNDLGAASDQIGAIALRRSNEIYKMDHGHGDPKRSTDSILAEAQRSARGGSDMYSLLTQGKSRAVVNDVRGAVEVMREHQANVRSGAAILQNTEYQEDVRNAAGLLTDVKGGIDNQIGSFDNRVAARKELAKDGGALDWYLDSEHVVMDDSYREARPGEVTEANGPVIIKPAFEAVPNKVPLAKGTSVDYTPDGKVIGTDGKTHTVIDNRLKDAGGNILNPNSQTVAVPAVQETRERVTTNREINKTIVGDRYAGMSDSEREAAVKRGQDNTNTDGP